MKTTDLDLDAIMAKHQPMSIDGQDVCVTCGDYHHTIWPCLPHRLAKRARDAEAKVATMQQQVLDAVRSMPLKYRPQDVAAELEHADFHAALGGDHD